MAGVSRVDADGPDDLPAGLRVALAHDYLTQRGGAERVVLDLAAAFPGAPLHTTLYQPDGTFPEFAAVDVRAAALNRHRVLREHHRLAMPLLARTVSRMQVRADVLLTSSSGWAHGIATSGRKIVYCHAPARWLYQRDRYLGRADGGAAARARRAAAAAALGLGQQRLRRWDAAAAAGADRYLANSTVTRDAVRAVYGIDAEIVPPPPALLPDGAESAVQGVEPGFVLCVARLLPYKNVDVILDAAARLPNLALIVVGGGPQLSALRARAAGLGPRVRLLGRVPDEHLRWLYRSAALLVAASYEDYGLSPLEAAAFGKPTVALRAGGYLDTVRAGETGMFFDQPTPDEVAVAIEAGLARSWDDAALRAHAERFSAATFRRRIRAIVAQEASR